MEIDKRIVDFIKKHHVLTLASSTINQKGESEAYCANMFYVYIEKLNAFVFTSDDATRHIQDVKVNNLVAGTIVVESTIVGKLQGLQFQGRLFKATEQKEGYDKAKTSYLKKFPFAAL